MQERDKNLAPSIRAFQARDWFILVCWIFRRSRWWMRYNSFARKAGKRILQKTTFWIGPEIWKSCWWFRNPKQPPDIVLNLVDKGNFFYLSTGAGFLPSTVSTSNLGYIQYIYIHIGSTPRMLARLHQDDVSHYIFRIQNPENDTFICARLHPGWWNRSNI